MIKVLLLLGLLSAFAYALRAGTSSTHLALRRVAGGCVLVVGAISVVFPSLVTSMANFVGVGRGTDLVLYIFLVVSLFVWVGMYRRIHELERRLLKLSRRYAVDSATQGTAATSDEMVVDDRHLGRAAKGS